MIEPNLIALLSDDEMNRPIPETLKEAAWQRYLDEDGKLAYSQRTWGAMTTDIHYLAWYGETTVVENATWKGKRLDKEEGVKRHVVKGRFKLEDNVEALSEENFIIIQVGDLPKFLNENSDGVVS